MKINEIKKAKAVYSELSIVRESATVTCMLAQMQRQVAGWKSFRVKKKKASGVL